MAEGGASTRLVTSVISCGIRRLFRNGVCDWSEADVEQ
jgi:hypothetical protein